MSIKACQFVLWVKYSGSIAIQAFEMELNFYVIPPLIF